jgi:hypothetical protein
VIGILRCLPVCGLKVRSLRGSPWAEMHASRGHGFATRNVNPPSDPLRPHSLATSWFAPRGLLLANCSERIDSRRATCREDARGKRDDNHQGAPARLAHADAPQMPISFGAHPDAQSQYRTIKARCLSVTSCGSCVRLVACDLHWTASIALAGDGQRRLTRRKSAVRAVSRSST